MKSTSNSTFWVTNRSNRNVTLSDLAINIKAFTSINLLDERYHHYTIQQLEASRLSGSIFKKRDKISVRDIPPPKAEKNSIAIVRDAIFPTKERSLFVITQTEYDELKFDDKDNQNRADEEYAKEVAELAESDFTTLSKKV